MKRIFDIVISIVALAALAPFLLVIAIVIELDSRGPILYRGARVGKDGKTFRIYKFRTMIVNAEKLGGPTTSNDDNRVTRSGKLLRRFKLDELPQFINVLMGDMSIVGPRPEVRSEVDGYGAEWKVIFTVRPGITDLASIEFRNEGEMIAESGISDPHEAYRTLIQPRKLELQREYVSKRSFWMDVKIILKTMQAVVGGA